MVSNCVVLGSVARTWASGEFSRSPSFEAERWHIVISSDDCTKGSCSGECAEGFLRW